MQPIEYKDILVIINPNSGNKRATKLVDKINSLNPNISTVVTHNLEELKNVFNSGIEKFKAFIVVGGDGTVNEAIKYLLDKNDKLLGVLPAGSGNEFARELGFKKSIENLIRDTKKCESINIDVLSINGSNCINAAGLGFDSFVAHDFQKRNSRGLKSYILSVLKSIFAFTPFNATLIIDEEKIQGKFQMITIANTRQFGNNALISPLSNPNDGIFELVVVKPFPFYLYPIFIIRLFSGSLKNSKYLKYIKVKDSVEIKSEYKKYHIDGEPHLFTKNLSIKMLKHKVRIIKTEHCPY
ncbi:MAG: YegS/Rv2252/BmrU family lipid kinase [Bacteroidetes bacterium]|nr:YegS/Rv2252/BmrU family lipid kinase [Bacteroidota bacterium]